MRIEGPQAIVARSPMRRTHFIAIALAILLNALDGFDVLSISFGAPGIAAEWGIDRAGLGTVLSMELICMAAGSIGLVGLCKCRTRDVTAQGLLDADLYARTLKALLDKTASTACCLGSSRPMQTCNIELPPTIGAIEALTPANPVVFAGLDEGAPGFGDYISRLRALGVLYFSSSERAVRTLARIAVWRALDPAVADAAPIRAARLPAAGGVVPDIAAGWCQSRRRSRLGAAGGEYRSDPPA